MAWTQHDIKITRFGPSITLHGRNLSLNGMAWTGSLQFPAHVQYLIENKVSKLTKDSKKEQWLECYQALRKHKHYIYNAVVNNKPLIFPSSLWTFVHHAAYHSAPLEILQMINIDRYPLSLPDGEGKLAVDHLDQRAPHNYRDLLKPSYKVDFLPLEMKLIQANFHAVIYDCMEATQEEEHLILPVLSVLLEDICKRDEYVFNAQQTGTFKYRFEFDNCRSEVAALLCEFSPHGSGDEAAVRFVCTADGWRSETNNGLDNSLGGGKKISI